MMDTIKEELLPRHKLDLTAGGEDFLRPAVPRLHNLPTNIHTQNTQLNGPKTSPSHALGEGCAFESNLFFPSGISRTLWLKENKTFAALKQNTASLIRALLSNFLLAAKHDTPFTVGLVYISSAFS